jgi:DNA polymerase III delta subunit
MQPKKTGLPEYNATQVMFFSGDDYIGREKAKERIFSNLFARYPELIQGHFDSSRESFEEYVERMISPSLFPAVRLFHVLHAQLLTPDQAQALASALAVDFQDVFISIQWEPQDIKQKKKESFADIVKIRDRIKTQPEKFAHFEFKKPPEYKMAAWLTEQVPVLFRRTISKASAEALLDLTGHELDRVYAELQKIDINLPEGAAIGKEAIEKIIGATREMSVFELADACSRKDMPRALTIIESLFQTGFAAPLFVSALFHHFWRIFKVRAYALENRDRVNEFFKARYTDQTRIAHEIGVASGLLRKDDPEKKAYPVMILSGVIDHARRFTGEQLRHIFSWLERFDVGVKTGTVKPTKQSVELLCYRIIRVAELEEKGVAA